MRNIDKIVIHCSATTPNQDVGADEIRKWHVKGKGWDDIGYHYVISRSGEVEKGRDLETPGAHVRGHNTSSIGICLIGGIDDDGSPDANFTARQYLELYHLVRALKYRFPDAKIMGHRDLANRNCPCFDVESFFQSSF